MLRAQTTPTPYYFRSYSSDNGLSNNSVNVVAQDRNGLMYFGTKDGLNLYNGISSRTFRKENSALGNNFIMSLFEDTDGNMWIGTEDRGLFLYNTSTGSITPFTHPELYPNIHGLCMIGDELWVGTFSGGQDAHPLGTSNLLRTSPLP